jgi:succinoglycan biosynthesis protein ExoO
MTGRAPSVSIVTANFNGARFLAPAIGSALAQSLADFELIVIDDGSTDDSLAIIEQAAARDRRVRVLRQAQTGGPGAARNRGLDAARGRWIAIFDGDDLMDPDRLRILVKHGEADQADIVVDNLAIFSEPGGPQRPFLTGSAFAAPRWLELADLVGSARLYARGPDLGYLKPLIRASALRGLRYRTDVRIGEDYDLLLRLLLGGARLRLEPQALYRYRKHGASSSHRLTPEHVRRMIAADLACADAFARQPPRVRRLQQARMRSLQRALVYEQVIQRLKARELAPALAESLAHPGIWPLLTLPITARAVRLAARLGLGSAGGHALA